jgi:lipopolysaccharide export system protein LptC
VAHLLRQLKYSLQANRKTKEGASHPDRNAQFEHINAQTQEFQERGQAVVSVDAKEREHLVDDATYIVTASQCGS